MKETKEQIAKRLKTYYVEELEELYELTAQILLGNTDFEAAAAAGDENDEDMVPIVEDMTGKKIQFGYEDIISREDFELFKKIAAPAEKRILKAEMIDTISSVYASDTLFEGLCLSSGVPEEYLESLCEEMGCGGRYAEITADPIFRRRKEYMNLIGKYARAAANLYGCIHVSEFLKLVKKYEKHFKRAESCVREEGPYRYTIGYSPEFFSEYTVHNIITNSTPGICMSFDAFILHPCFRDEVSDETMEMFKFFPSLGYEPDRKDLDAFTDSIWDKSYFRYIYDMTGDMDRYIPRKMEFMKYSSLDYYEKSTAEAELREYLKENFFEAFETRAQKIFEEFADQGMDMDGLEPDVEEELDIFMESIHGIISDNGKLEENDPLDIIKKTLNLTRDYGISFKGDAQRNKVVGLVMDAANNTRLWINNGHTPNELSPFEVPEIKKKVYPNDPCPCGSGKKYKKCCGR